MSKVVILGGSFGGYTAAKALAKSLPESATLTLVDKRVYHQDTFAFPRYSVVGGWEDTAFIPLQDRDTTGTEKINLVIDECTGLTESDVLLKSGKKLPYTYLIVATGRLQHPPGNLSTDDKEVAIEDLKGFQSKVKDASTIAVVGAGAAGVELSGDIKDVYPEKSVDLYSSREHILPRFDSRVGILAEPVLEKLGVKIHAKCRPSVDGNRLTLPNGETHDYDTVFFCAGEIAVNSPFRSLLGDLVSDKGHLTVNDYFQVKDNIFAIGDVTDVGPKIAASAMMQAACVSDNVLALIQGKPMAKYVHNDMVNSCHLTLGISTDLNFMPGKDPEIIKHDATKQFDCFRIWRLFDVDPTEESKKYE